LRRYFSGIATTPRRATWPDCPLEICERGARFAAHPVLAGVLELVQLVNDGNREEQAHGFDAHDLFPVHLLGRQEVQQEMSVHDGDVSGRSCRSLDAALQVLCDAIQGGFLQSDLAFDQMGGP
jgi:hypothetical protein